jgi:hypothetical protein
VADQPADKACGNGEATSKDADEVNRRNARVDLLLRLPLMCPD